MAWFSTRVLGSWGLYAVIFSAMGLLLLTLAKPLILVRIVIAIGSYLGA